MITIPNKGLEQKYEDIVSVLWEALFLEVVDSRLTSFLSPEDFEDKVNTVREHPLAESFYEMLQIFGEDDFYTFVLPSVKELQDTYPKGKNFELHFEKCFNKLIDKE